MKIKNILAITSVIFIIAAIVYGYILSQQIFKSNTSFSEKNIYINIPSDATYLDIEKIVAPYVTDIESFRSTANKMNYTSGYKPGRFLINYGMSNFEIIKSLKQNIPVKVTFNNQETIEDFAGRIAQQIEPDSLSILNGILDPEFLKLNELTPETALTLFIPNTHEFYWNTTVSQFRDKMAKEYRKFWSQERLEKAKALNMTPAQINTLASIVQKETVKADERPMVAGAYLNRLKINMPLQADPTAVYAYKKHTGDFNQVIKRVKSIHTNIDSPYNTYKIQGLPIGPIVMSDISAIDAVLNYQDHDYIYFCASVDRIGYHEFAKTYAEHQRNSAKYHKWLNQQGY